MGFCLQLQELAAQEGEVEGEGSFWWESVWAERREEVVVGLREECFAGGYFGFVMAAWCGC